MSLATRCAACGTVFRVVQDQLKVSEGWVRCGRCAEIFNAGESLFDLSREAPPPWSGSRPAELQAPSPPAVTQAQAAVDPAAQGSGAATPAGGESSDRLRPALALPAPAAPPSAGSTQEPTGDLAHLLRDRPLLMKRSAPDEPAADTEEEDGTGFQDARFNTALLDGEAGAAVPAAVPPRPAARPPASPRPAPPTLDDEAPTFVRQANRAERWQQPGVRAGMAALAVLLTVLLMAQLAWTGRSWLATRWPGAQGLLASACSAFGCTLEAPRRLDGLLVDSSSLLQADAPGRYRLNIVLRNRLSAALQLPAIELALTDSQGDTVSRRILAPRELGARSSVIGEGAELPLQATLFVDGPRVAGYTVEIFYP